MASFRSPFFKTRTVICHFSLQYTWYLYKYILYWFINEYTNNANRFVFFYYIQKKKMMNNTNTNTNTNNNMNNNGSKLLKKKLLIDSIIEKKRTKIVIWSKRATFVRHCIISCIVLYFLQKQLNWYDTLFPYGYPISSILSSLSLSTSSSTKNTNFTQQSLHIDNNLLQYQYGLTYRITDEQQQRTKLTVIAEGDEITTEDGMIIVPTSLPYYSANTVVSDPIDGSIYILTDTAKILKVSTVPTATSNSSSSSNINTNHFNYYSNFNIIKNLGTGMPLSGVIMYSNTNTNIKNNNDNNNNNNNNNNNGPTMYIANAGIGLVRVQNLLNPFSKVEIVVSNVIGTKTKTTTDDNNNNNNNSNNNRIPLLFPNGITINKRNNNKIYYTDSSNVIPERHIRQQTESSIRYSDHDHNLHQQQQQQQHEQQQQKSPSRRHTKETSSLLPDNDILDTYDQEDEFSTPSNNSNNSNSTFHQKTKEELLDYEHVSTTKRYQMYWDTIYPFVLEILLRGGTSSGGSSTTRTGSPIAGTGRLVEYDPITDTVQILVHGLYYPSGISYITAHSSSSSSGNDNNNSNNDDEFLFIVESLNQRILQYNIQTKQTSTLYDMSNIPGYPTSMDCTTITTKTTSGTGTSTTTTTCYVAMQYPSLTHLSSYIVLKSWLLRAIVMSLPRSIVQRILFSNKRSTGIVQLTIQQHQQQVGTTTTTSSLDEHEQQKEGIHNLQKQNYYYIVTDVQIFMDQYGKDWDVPISSITYNQFDNKVYFGTSTNNNIKNNEYNSCSIGVFLGDNK